MPNDDENDDDFVRKDCNDLSNLWSNTVQDGAIVEYCTYARLYDSTGTVTYSTIIDDSWM